MDMDDDYTSSSSDSEYEYNSTKPSTIFKYIKYDEYDIKVKKWINNIWSAIEIGEYIEIDYNILKFLYKDDSIEESKKKYIDNLKNFNIPYEIINDNIHIFWKNFKKSIYLFLTSHIDFILELDQIFIDYVEYTKDFKINECNTKNEKLKSIVISLIKDHKPDGYIYIIKSDNDLYRLGKSKFLESDYNYKYTRKSFNYQHLYEYIEYLLKGLRCDNGTYTLTYKDLEKTIDTIINRYEESFKMINQCKPSLVNKFLNK